MTTTLHTLDPLRDVRGMDHEDDAHRVRCPCDRDDHDAVREVVVLPVVVVHDGHTLGMAYRLRAGGWIADLWGESRPRTLTADDGSEAAFATLAEASRALLAAAAVS